MSKQDRFDAVAAVAIVLMFVGAFLLTWTSSGLVLIGVGAAAMLVIIVSVVANRQQLP